MKKNLLLTALFTILISSVITAQVNTSNKTLPKAKDTEVQLVSSDIETTVIDVKVNNYDLLSADPSDKTIFKVSADDAVYMQIAGAPDLSKIATSIIIPDDAEMQVDVLSSSYTDYENVNIAPSKGNLLRTVDPSTVPFEYGSAYSKDEFYPDKLTDLGEPYILRDFRGQVVNIYPFQYNPVSKVLRVYSDISVKVSRKSNNGINVFNRIRQITKIDQEFKEIYENHFLNLEKSTLYTPLDEHGNMLIICYDSYMAAMQPFVDWKNTIGIPTEMVSVTTAGGTANAIKTYVTNYYNTNGLTFLLLVGDAAQCPTLSSNGGGSDNMYGYITGSDYYQEIIIGRFSAENTTHVTTQVNRTINYEKTPCTTPGLFNKLIGIGSDQGPGDENEYDYQHIRAIETDLLGFTYTTPIELFDGSQGGVDASGDPTAASVTAVVNPGAGIINYCGHGSDNSWGTTGFSNTEIATLTNTNVQPFIWSVACVNGNFTAGTCFAEGWLRQTSGGQPAGAIATLMSTINQSWNPPMEGQDEMDSILVESYTSNIKRTFGGISVNGLFKMNDTYQDYAMTDTWTVFGDPSVMVRTADPMTMTVTHQPTTNLGASQLVVNCDVEGAFIALTINHQIIGTGYATGGSATISFSALTQIDTITVAATAFNYTPYIGTVLIISSTGPYVVYSSYVMHDVAGNNNGQADYNEDITFDIVLQNVGATTASGVTAVISTSDLNVLITDNTQSWGTITVGSSSTQNDAYAVTVNNSIPDQHVANFSILISDGSSNSWNGLFTLTLNAPSLSVGTIIISDPTGNNNGRLDPGETADITISEFNNGHADANSVQSVLSTTNSDITLNSYVQTLGNISSGGGTANSVFNITVNPTAVIGTVADLTNILTAGAYSGQKTFYPLIGLVDEDWESGDFTKFDWVQGTHPWTITGTLPFEGTYSAKSGTITDNQTSELSLTMTVLSNDSISFYAKTSSEDGWDFMKFYLDGTELGSWTGETDWTRAAYLVTAGSHIFKWTYEKDASVSGGSDCAWLDYILFPPVQLPVSVSETVDGMNNTLSCYPSPSNGENIIIRSSANGTLSVINSNGKLVNKIMINKGTSVIDTKTMADGLYYFILTEDNAVITKKVLITR
jgi:hypothetical protein